MQSTETQQRFDRRALVAASVVGCLGFVGLEIYERRLVLETSGGEPVPVVVVASDVPEGTVLARPLLGVRALPASYVEERHVRADDLGALLGAKLAVKLRASEAVLWTDLAAARREATELSSLVQPGMRAVVVRAGTFDGLLRTGDRVDVLGAASPSPSDAALLQNLVVLAVGGAVFGEEGAHAGSEEEVTLGGTVEQGKALAEIARAGSVSLALRGPYDVGVAPEARTEPRSAPDLPHRGRTPVQEIEHVR
jgi:pilus assembly protein CpaB